jgi:hypothetical protein
MKEHSQLLKKLTSVSSSIIFLLLAGGVSLAFASLTFTGTSITPDGSFNLLRTDPTGDQTISGAHALTLSNDAATLTVGSTNKFSVMDGIVTVSTTITDLTGQTANYSITTTGNPSANASAGLSGLQLETQTQPGNTKNFAFITGVYSEVDHYGSGTVSGLEGGEFDAFVNPGSGLVSDARGLYVISGGGGNITNSSGLFIDSGGTGFSGGTTTNNYGIFVSNQAHAGNTNSQAHHIDDQGSGANDYAIYSAGGKSYFAGNVGLGTTQP